MSLGGDRNDMKVTCPTACYLLKQDILHMFITSIDLDGKWGLQS